MSVVRVFRFSLLLLLVALAPARIAYGEARFGSGPAASASAAVQRPVRGMTMEEVEGFFGTPAQKFAAVGKPPISRWRYDHFTVYFEYTHVIHAVMHR